VIDSDFSGDGDLLAHRSSQEVGNFGDRLWGDSMILVIGEILPIIVPIDKTKFGI